MSAAEGRPYSNPVKAQKGADPWISYHEGNYHLVSTSWTDVITIRKSPTLAGLSTAPSVQVWQGDAASRCCNIWAPELHYSGGRWYLYYVAWPEHRRLQPDAARPRAAECRFRPDGTVHVPEPAG